jgi:mono/diheme cytochrome c family protein
MKSLSTVRSRFAVLAAVLILGIGVSVPLIGNAQDEAPDEPLTEEQLIQQGETIFSNVCIACHQPDGMGIPGIFPALNGNPLLTLEDPSYFISTVLTGRGGMPPFEGIYTDEEIAAVVSFVRQNWNNGAAAVSPEQVGAIRAELEATPMPEATPTGQRPAGEVSASPESAASGSPEATPDATP